MSIVAALDPAALFEVIRKMVLLGKSISNVPLKLELFPPKLISSTGPVLINRKVPPGLPTVPKAALIVSSVTAVDWSKDAVPPEVLMIVTPFVRLLELRSTSLAAVNSSVPPLRSMLLYSSSPVRLPPTPTFTV